MVEAALQGAERIRESLFSQKKAEEEKRKMSNQLAPKTYDKHSHNWMHETPESCLDLMTWLCTNPRNLYKTNNWF